MSRVRRNKNKKISDFHPKVKLGIIFIPMILRLLRVPHCRFFLFFLFFLLSFFFSESVVTGNWNVNGVIERNESMQEGLSGGRE